MEENTSSVSRGGMNKNIVIFVVIALLIAGGGIAFAAMQKQAPTAVQTQQVSPTAMEEMEGANKMNASPSSAMEKTGTTGAMSESGTVKEIIVEGSNFKFVPSTITVKKGDTVKVTFKNTGGMHDFVVDEFAGAKTSKISGGASETISFVADKVGTFEYYCSVGSHRQMGMKGNLIVQ